MQQIQNIIFDLGGVLLNLDMQKTETAFTEMGVKNFKDLFALGHAASFFREYEVGSINDDEFITALQNLAGIRAERAAVIAGWNAMLRDFPAERIELLIRLKKNYRIFLFSNTNAIHLTAFQKTYSDAFGGNLLDTLFEKTWYSHNINRRKPDVKAFEYVLQDAQLLPHETLFIDDALVNVEGARAAGMQGYHLEPGKTVLEIGEKLLS
ncbi:HAD family phosphatase [Paraflavitalea soli]|uniref:HAD family phosphatase n=1 Tax=Paraflavitalea soli TaxID=2315862 RepID=A0A3B7N401_9BACT|nr:HAD family phosphatase [Paraflavitalea soli]AXY76921.1 HAD family phosphatase [Paraflavitalea soli]